MIALFTVPGRNVFDPVIRQSDLLIRAASLLRDSLTNRDEILLEHALGLRVEERGLITDLSERLRRTLVTPIHHEDLMMLSSGIRRVRRGVTRATERVIAFGPDATAEMTSMAAIAAKSCDLLALRIEALRRSRNAAVGYFAFHETADAAKSIAREAAPRILSGPDAVSAIKQHEILGLLRDATLTAKKTADWIDYTVVRNG